MKVEAESGARMGNRRWETETGDALGVAGIPTSSGQQRFNSGCIETTQRLLSCLGPVCDSSQHQVIIASGRSGRSTNKHILHGNGLSPIDLTSGYRTN
ncbi:unnamed protein product [Protopolystoma xenopodis]|uniref:Uncharacterized protein n=1 Tax=Protopolystoma xenopodis TaxID=117903 RepID=A0A448WC13_9PLAT|nr:unnamed protein product [Protopolystoma xenopodis]